MADYNWLDNDDDDDDDAPSGRSNDALSEARKAARRNARENKELKERLATFEKRDRERTVTDAVREFGLNPKIASLVPKDVSTEDLPSFLKELSEVLGVTPAPHEDGESQATPAESVANETLDPNFAALQRISQRQGSAAPPVNADMEMLSKIAAAQTVEDLNMLLHGNPNGPQVY